MPDIYHFQYCEKMIDVYKKQIEIAPSLCDYSGHLSVPDVFGLFMDIATAHANSLGIGYAELAEKDLYWLTVKTKIRIVKRPFMNSSAELATWPEHPDRLFCTRDYTLSAGEELLACGKTEWGTINTKTGRLAPVAEIYPKELVISDAIALPDPFARFEHGFDGELIGEYTVKSTDIDVGGHMNNVAYVRAFAGFFSTEEWTELDPSDIEIIFKNQCFEGDKLLFKKRIADGIMTVQAFLPDGKAAVQIVIS